MGPSARRAHFLCACDYLGFARYRGNIVKSVLLACAIAFAALPASAKDAALYKIENCDNLLSQMELTGCYGDNYQAADDALNVVYKQVMASSLDQAAKDALRSSERAWIKSRDKQCDDETAADEGGSIRPMEIDICMQKKTDTRIGLLKKMLPAQ
jgi:uncharacterized protein YecT (DUF1311 family)